MNIAQADKEICAFCAEIRRIAGDPALNEKSREKQIKREKRAFSLKSKSTICYKELPFSDTLTVKEVLPGEKKVKLVFEERGAHGTPVEAVLKKGAVTVTPGDRVTVSGRLRAELSPYAFSDIYASHALWAAELENGKLSPV